MAVPKSYHRLFMTMCPTYAFIDRANAKMNRAMDFKKDYSALISAAWDIDTRYDDYLNNPEAGTYQRLEDLGLSPVGTDDADEYTMEARRDLIERIVSGKIVGSFASRYGGKIE